LTKIKEYGPHTTGPLVLIISIVISSFEAPINKPNPVYFLMVMNWFTTYQHVKEELAGTRKMDKKTIPNWLLSFTHSSIQAPKKKPPT
jgi:hypothetical protein